MADWLEAFVPLRIHVLVRFGRWDDLIAEPLPDDTRPVLHHRGDHPLRPRRRARLEGPAAAGARRARRVHRGVRPHSGHPVSVQQHRRDILAIAAEMLDGEIAYREGQFDDAFAHLRRAIELDDALPYDEPWGWMQPTRHAYGALLLEQGRVEDAAEVYAADLGLDPTLSPAVPAPGQRVEPARLPRMPAAAGPHRRGGDHRPTAGAGPGTRGRADRRRRALAGSRPVNRIRLAPARSRRARHHRSPRCGPSRRDGAGRSSATDPSPVPVFRPSSVHRTGATRSHLR